MFKPGWEIVRPVSFCAPAWCQGLAGASASLRHSRPPCRVQWLKKYAALVRFVSADEVRREFFTVETVPDEFAAQGFPAKAPTK